MCVVPETTRAAQKTVLARCVELSEIKKNAPITTRQNQAVHASFETKPQLHIDVCYDGVGRLALEQSLG